MSWKTVIVENADKVSLFLDSLVVTKNEIPRQFPISDLNCVIFQDYRAIVTTQILNKLAINSVMVIFCDVDLMPTSVLNPIDAHHLQFKIIKEQINWKIETKRELWAKIVKQKIESQLEILEENNKSAIKVEMLRGYIKEVQPGDVSNREGHAAKVYFNELFGNEFARSQDNIINAALNFGYTVIRSAFSRTIVSKGLHPSISLFHSNQYDAFALADDLMEPFRPVIDDFVYKNYQEWEYFGREQKQALVNLLNVQINFDGKDVFLTSAINRYVDNVINYMESGEMDYLVFPYLEHIQYYEL